MMKTRRALSLLLSMAAAVAATACASVVTSAPVRPTPPHGISGAAVDNTSATIAYYRFETGPDGATATSIIDSTLAHRNGTILAGGPKYSWGTPVTMVPKIDKLDHFSMSCGTGDAARFGYKFPFQTLTNATLEFWAFPIVASHEGDIFWTTTAVGSGDMNRFNIGIDPGGMPFIDYRTASGVLHQLGTGNIAIPTNQWSFIAYEKVGTKYMIFVNNSVTGFVTKVASTKTDTSPSLPTSTGWTMNGRIVEQPNGGSQFSGMLDEVRLSNVALSKSAMLVNPDTP